MFGKKADIKLMHIIGIPILMAVIISGFSIVFGNAVTQYNLSGNETLLNDLRDQTLEFQQLAQDYNNATASENFLVRTVDDITGGIYGKAISTFDLIKGAISLYGKVISQTFGLTNIIGDSDFTNLLIGTLASLVIVVIIVHILTKILFRIEV